jgi:hypothetical protein
VDRSKFEPKIKNPALSAGPIRHTWTNSRVAQLIATPVFVTDLHLQHAFAGLLRPLGPTRAPLAIGEYSTLIPLVKWS